MKLEINNLCKSFGDKEVLKGINFSCESGQSIALLGRNGAGKTTLFRCLLDIFSHDSGEILIDGQPINRKKLTFGYLPEERGLYLDRTIYEQMVYFGKLKGMSKPLIDERIDYLLDKLQATEYKFSMLDSLSKGNKQKIQLAIAVINDPDIVIFDEPFSGLDPVSSQLLKELIEDSANNGNIVIFSSHEMSYTEEFCETIAILNNGTIEVFGNLNDIKNTYPKTKIKVSLSQTNLDLARDLDITNLCNNIETKHGHYILTLKNESYIKQLQQLLVSKDYLLEEFVVLKPSLEQIFVEKVGSPTDSMKNSVDNSKVGA